MYSQDDHDGVGGDTGIMDDNDDNDSDTELSNNILSKWSSVRGDDHDDAHDSVHDSDNGEAGSDWG